MPLRDHKGKAVGRDSGTASAYENVSWDVPSALSSRTMSAWEETSLEGIPGLE